MSQPWYVSSFQEDYLKIYAHRTDEAAAEEVKQIDKMLKLTPFSQVLDLCCGNGRHSRQLAKLGCKVTGVDLSSALLQEAQKQNKDGRIKYVQCDVREIAFENEFDYILNLFTSFGYFEKVEENKRVFSNIYTALKPGGTFLVDYLNPPYVKATLVPFSERKVDHLVIKEKRRIEQSKVIKEIEVHECGTIRSYEERVNLFHLPEMVEMLEGSGLTVEQIYGDYDQKEYQPESSPRMILIGKK